MHMGMYWSQGFDKTCRNVDDGYAKIFTLCPVFGLQIIDETIYMDMPDKSSA